MFTELYANFSRSSLYSLEPIGVGTPYVESLSGYFSRLASHHSNSTGDLLAKKLVPLLNKLYLSNQAYKGGEGLYKSSNGINGLGTLAEDFSNILQSLTLRDDLKSLTLLKWSNIVPTRGLLRVHRAWCPTCYLEDKENHFEIYERLVWNFQLVEVCSKHNQHLSFICPYCDKTNPILSRKSRPGYCSICENWLGEKLQTGNQLIEMQQKDIFIRLINDLLSKNHVIEDKPNRSLISESLNFYLKECFEDSNSLMCRDLNVPKSTLKGWCIGGSLPQIKSLLEICIYLGVNISEFLLRTEVRINQESNDDIKVKSKSERKRYDHKKITKYLSDIIDNEESISINKVAEAIGCDRKLLYRLYQIECKKIKEINDRFLINEKSKRDKKKLKEVEDAFNQLITNNEYPSRRKMENIVGEGVLREKLLQEKWRALKKNCFINSC
ncbi:TniQ family protein [Cytobacillus gottheilii]|uniref:TniQ family protein n=1 Tax=Cytobacillus gottheilii TaxID=859144 RepID=UPI0008365605|nr:TniQ family protein [Cytobacillus gottheilii]